MRKRRKTVTFRRSDVIPQNKGRGMETRRLIVLMCAGLIAATPALARGGGGGFGGGFGGGSFGFGGIGGTFHGGGFGNFGFQRSPRFVRPHVFRNRIVSPFDRRFAVSRFAAQRFGGGVDGSFFWPFGWYTGVGAPVEQTTPLAPAPQVIILSNNQPLPRTTAEPSVPPDFEYVPGCRAIPNGYRCDVHG